MLGENQLRDEQGRVLSSIRIPSLDRQKRWSESIPGWWESEPGVGRVADGVPDRVDRLKGIGNAVSPVIPYIIGQAINKIEAEKEERKP
jgi:DNA (cytosine-5)-methyltransferase 1